MTNVFIDFGKRKQNVAVIEEKSQKAIQSTYILNFSSIINLLEKLPEKNNLMFFIESGNFKSTFLYDLLNYGRVFETPGKNTKNLREKLSLLKTDVNDALCLQQVFYTHSEVFKEVKRENLNMKFAFKKYQFYTKQIVRLRNLSNNYVAEYGPDKEYSQLSILEINNYEKLRSNVIKPYKKELHQITKQIGIKGFGPVLLGLILTRANPTKFHSLSSWLFYLGLKASAMYKDPCKGYVKGNILKNRNRGEITYNFSDSLIRNKDILYSKLKKDLQVKFPNDSKLIIHNKTKNRYRGHRIFREGC